MSGSSGNSRIYNSDQFTEEENSFGYKTSNFQMQNQLCLDENQTGLDNRSTDYSQTQMFNQNPNYYPTNAREVNFATSTPFHPQKMAHLSSLNNVQFLNKENPESIPLSNSYYQENQRNTGNFHSNISHFYPYGMNYRYTNGNYGGYCKL